VGQRGGTLYFKIEGSLHSFHFVFLSDRAIKLGGCKKEKENKIGNLFTISIIE
jgi:hypothetical protein